MARKHSSLMNDKMDLATQAQQQSSVAQKCFHSDKHQWHKCFHSQVLPKKVMLDKQCSSVQTSPLAATMQKTNAWPQQPAEWIKNLTKSEGIKTYPNNPNSARKQWIITQRLQNWQPKQDLINLKMVFSNCKLKSSKQVSNTAVLQCCWCTQGPVLILKHFQCFCLQKKAANSSTPGFPDAPIPGCKNDTRDNNQRLALQIRVKGFYQHDFECMLFQMYVCSELCQGTAQCQTRIVTARKLSYHTC